MNRESLEQSQPAGYRWLIKITCKSLLDNGPARRSDIVAVEFATRSLQARLDETWLHIQQQQLMPRLMTRANAHPYSQQDWHERPEKLQKKG
mmetsp:Transcript_72745/g.144202  ORF Transcript_72745/g.144202 Transcript_72745/m.144202 type:complete len:92 (+) Transcript_72745:240-515(+)